MTVGKPSWRPPHLPSREEGWRQGLQPVGKAAQPQRNERLFAHSWASVQYNHITWLGCAFGRGSPTPSEPGTVGTIVHPEGHVRGKGGSGITERGDGGV